MNSTKKNDENNSRQAAFMALLRIEKDRAYANLTLNSALSGLDGRDAAFCSALIYGVTERQITLDWLLSKQLKKPLKQLRPPVLTLLRMGAYQLLFMDSVPASAAVNTAVRLLKSNGCAYAAGLANAVLRQLSNLISNDEFLSKSDALDKILPNDLGIRYSVPNWLAELWISAYGHENTEAILKASFGGGENYIRVNTKKITRGELIKLLAEEGISALPSLKLSNAAILPKGVAPQKTRAFADGLYHAQGLASQICAATLKARPDWRVLDMCAAPGGKAFTIAQELTAGNLVALELYPQRAELIRKGAERLGLLNITVHSADASKARPEELGSFDAVLCDAPCSGLGTLGKKPDIRQKTRASLDNLPEIQYTLLMNAVNFLHPNGRLVYSSCTLNPDENEKVCERFLENNSQFKADETQTLFPHIHGCDGFFIASFTKGDVLN